MSDSPLVRLVKIPWWLNLLIGLGLMSLGELVKRAPDGPLMPIVRPFGDALQVLSVFFVVLAMASFLIGATNEFSGEADTVSRVRLPPATPAAPPENFGPAAARPPQPARQAPAGPPPQLALPGQPPQQAPAPAQPVPPKKKYSERDFMPPSMRAELSAKERKEEK